MTPKFGDFETLGRKAAYQIRRQLAVPVQTACRQTYRRPQVDYCTWGHGYKRVSGAPRSWLGRRPPSVCTGLQTAANPQQPAGEVSGLGKMIFFRLFIYGPDYSARKKHVHTHLFPFRTRQTSNLENQGKPVMG